MRESNAEIMAGIEYVPGTAKRIANNTVRYQTANGDIRFRLHQTDVIIKKPDGSTILNSGGWKTSTTKERINAYSSANIYSARGVWYIGRNESAIPFQDGMRIGPRGELPKVRASVADKQIKLGKLICEFVKLVGKDGAPIPQPGPGDCWLCSFAGTDGKTMGELGDQESEAEHMLGHIREKYLHGYLIVRALKWAGIPNTGIGLYLSGIGAPKHTTIKSALRRYLRHKLRLAS